MASSSQADRMLPLTILHNAAPSLLDVSMYVTFDQQIGDSAPQTEVGLGFLSGAQGVEFAGDEHVRCNGVDLPTKNRAADFQVLRAPTAQVAGTTVRCEYSAGGAVAGIALQIPTLPAITSPMAGAQVARSKQTLIAYRFDPTTTRVIGIVALAPGSAMPKAIASLNTPGTSQATVDTSAFAPLQGSLVLTASLSPHVTPIGAPFHSVSCGGSATVPVTVIWS